MVDLLMTFTVYDWPVEVAGKTWKNLVHRLL